MDKDRNRFEEVLRVLPAPFTRGETWALYCADCLELLPMLPDRCVDAVVTDIPYGEVNRQSNGLRNLDKGDADLATFSAAWCALESARVGKSAYIWCGTEQVSEIRATLVNRGMSTRLCGWEKSNPSPLNGEHLWLSSFECCVFGKHSGAPFDARCESPVWHGPIERGQLHPTQKPLWLMRIPVSASTQDGDICLDFCCGSGTTGVACIRLGRYFIGIEISEDYCKIAERRLREADESQALFRPEVMSGKPEQLELIESD